jgi:hypothetical protein
MQRARLVEPEFELGVGDDDAARRRILGRAPVELERNLTDPLGEWRAVVSARAARSSASRAERSDRSSRGFTGREPCASRSSMPVPTDVERLAASPWPPWVTAPAPPTVRAPASYRPLRRGGGSLIGSLAESRAVLAVFFSPPGTNSEVKSNAQYVDCGLFVACNIDAFEASRAAGNDCSTPHGAICDMKSWNTPSLSPARAWLASTFLPATK